MMPAYCRFMNNQTLVGIDLIVANIDWGVGAYVSKVLLDFPNRRNHAHAECVVTVMGDPVTSSGNVEECPSVVR